ncbi:hypothetical protein [Micromonospora ureilytica]|nr:hypothetical protein [Micromonospora ureilytica]
MSRRRKTDGEVRAPRWAMWCTAVGGLLVVASSAAAVVLAVAR